MKKLFILLAASILGSGAYAQHLGTEYRLKKVIQVPARQGIAADKDYFYNKDVEAANGYAATNQIQLMGRFAF